MKTPTQVKTRKAITKNLELKMFQKVFPNSFPDKRPLIYSTAAASKDILFWTPRGQLLRNQRIIPVTKISELVEYVLLPQNDDVVKPRALKTFIDGLAELLGINKRLIQNILAELLEKEQAYRDKDSDAGDDEILSESSDNEGGTGIASEYSEHHESESPDLEPEGNSDVPYTEKNASSEILLKGKGP